MLKDLLLLAAKEKAAQIAEDAAASEVARDAAEAAHAARLVKREADLEARLTAMEAASRSAIDAAEAASEAKLAETWKQAAARIKETKRAHQADLEAKTGGLWGYLKRIPKVFFDEAVFGSTVLRVTTTNTDGRVLDRSEGRMVEALYTNRAFIGGVGGVPSTNPSALAGQSSLILVPPVLYRGPRGGLLVDLSGLASFIEAILKGVAGRAMHALGLGVGNLAGGGAFWSAKPTNQITLKEGQAVQLDFFGTDGRHRAVATQVSGDPYQCWTMQMRVAWGPLPLLAAPDSLLMAAAQRALTCS